MSDLGRRVSRLAPLLCTALGCLSVVGFAQGNAMLVGVAIMQNSASASISVPGNVERDRLAQALNLTKPDKKTHIQVQAVTLDGITASEVSDESVAKKCAYVLFTKLTEFRSPDVPNQGGPGPGTVETNPNSQWSIQVNASTRRPDPGFAATVEYKLQRLGRYGASTGSSFSLYGNVDEIMDRIAVRVADEIKKGTPAMHE